MYASRLKVINSESKRSQKDKWLRKLYVYARQSLHIPDVHAPWRKRIRHTFEIHSFVEGVMGDNIHPQDTL